MQVSRSPRVRNLLVPDAVRMAECVFGVSSSLSCTAEIPVVLYWEQTVVGRSSLSACEPQQMVHRLPLKPSPQITTLLAGCAAAISAMGLFITFPAPAHAEDRDCTQWEFNGDFTFQTTYGSGITLTQRTKLTGESAQANATARGGDGPLFGEITGPLTARIDGDRIHMTWETGPLVSLRRYEYYGSVDKEGRPGAGVGSTSDGDNFAWTSENKLKCAEWAEPDPSATAQGQKDPDDPAPQLPKPGPQVDVKFDVPSPGMVTVTVHDLSAEDSECTYTATPQPPALPVPTIQKFPLKAGEYRDLTFGPLAKLGITYHIVVDCEGGKTTTKDPVY